MATRLLVVDDDRAVRESLRRALALEGYDVDLAVDGAEALARPSFGRPFNHDRFGGWPDA